MSVARRLKIRAEAVRGRLISGVTPKWIMIRGDDGGILRPSLGREFEREEGETE
jgi:hypothetical protein